MSKPLFSFLYFCILFSFSDVFAQKNIPEQKFIGLLLRDSEEALELISPQEIQTSQRLNTTFIDVKSKLLLSFSSSISYSIKEKINNGEAASIETSALDYGYSKSVLSVPAYNYSAAFYFKESKAITPLSYFTRNWKKQTGKYFNFLISDEKLFNPYCINELDEYVDRVASLLKFSNEDLKLLQEQKILYVFCKDNEEIKNITGSVSKGRYLSELDAVVTTYSCHFHEVSHLLLNYKLKENYLYTLPFLQEGFAVATGGRGGQSSNVLNDIGYYIVRYDFADYRLMLDDENFRKEDPSVSYPVSGIFSNYLLSILTADEYVAFYKLHSDNGDNIGSAKLDPFDKVINGFAGYISQYKAFQDISFTASNDNEEVEVSGSFFLTPQNFIEDYSSSKFSEIFKDKNRDYKGEKYYFAIDKNEINIYNLYSNELIASYVNSFADTPVEYFSEEKYKFFIRKNLLNESLKDLNLSY